MNAALVVVIAVVALLVGVSLASFWHWRSNRMRARRVNELIDFLEQASLGNAGLLTTSGEDDLARLQDEIGKTVTALERTRNQALAARKNYAHNLSNIAHQVKTPLAVLSLATQRINRTATPETAAVIDAIDTQIERLNRLQSDLLLMAKLDTGTLTMDLWPHDLYTIIVTAAESMEEFAASRGIELALAENGAVNVLVDEHWIIEAITNLVKNCIEHAPANSAVTIAYESNPLYASVVISDAGPGFTPEDSLHLFERFYTGTTRSKTGTGLGLSFACELIEAQGGTIEARNLPEGGACFDIRIYARHSAVTLSR